MLWDNYAHDLQEGKGRALEDNRNSVHCGLWGVGLQGLHSALHLLFQGGESQLRAKILFSPWYAQAYTSAESTMGNNCYL